ncbi:MAG: EAL domain-containing protein [Gammaproteobacteria bacterium]
MDYSADNSALPVKGSLREDVLAGGGEMGNRIRAFDWSKTPLGPMQSWPQSLLSAINTCLTAPYPMILWWGPCQNVFYNDSCIPLFAAKHQKILGQSGARAWEEAWDIIGPLLESVMMRGEEVGFDEQFLLFNNNTLQGQDSVWSYRPIRIEQGNVSMVPAIATETSRRILGERRNLGHAGQNPLVEAVHEQASYILENISDGFITLDRDWCFTYVNAQATHIMGKARADLIGINHWEIFPQVLGSPLETKLRRAAFAPVTVEFENYYQPTNTCFEIKAFPTHSGGISVFFRDITQRKRAEKDIVQSKEDFRMLIDQAPDAIFIADAKGVYIDVNSSACRMLGYARDELIGKTMVDLLRPEDLPRLENFSQHQLLLQGHQHLEEWELLCKNGTYLPVEISARMLPDHRWQAFVRDISERKRLEARLVHEAFHDALTGLPNQASFMKRLEQAVEQNRRQSDHLYAVLFLDLDRFKFINDSIGHIVGDQLLASLARRLELCVRHGDTVARFGGDEFTILLKNFKDVNDVTQVADRIKRELAMPFNLSGHEVFTNASIGIALSASGYERAEDVLRDSDIAMYRAKARGKARHEIFNPGMHASSVELWKLDADLRRAIERDEFMIFYQPIVSLINGKIIGVEALARWQHPVRGLVMPEDFIPLAEETGAITVIGEWVLRKACAQSKLWHDAGYSLRLAVNFSARQFQSQNLPKLIKSVLDETGLPPQFFDMEITESVAMQNIDSGIPILSELSSMDINISIDDFGTGYSSLGYLQHFPVNTLKIDRSFICSMTSAAKDTAIPKAIIAMAHGLKLRVVAEGVETQEQLAFLHEHHCDSMQGYLFSRPLPADKFTELLRDKDCLEKILDH